VTHSSISNGTLVKRQRTWLITWEWTRNHAKVDDEDNIVAILDARTSERTIEELIKRLYVSKMFTYQEQLAYLKSNKDNRPLVQHGVVKVDQNLREKASLPPWVPVADQIICGENPWLWARIVHQVEAYLDLDGREHLRWKEHQQRIWRGSKIEGEEVECHWVR
jgi:hypothetical protein